MNKAAIVLALLLVAVGWGLADDESETKVFRIDAENWEFIPNAITVHQGEHVVLEIRSFDATHRFDLKAYGLKVLLPQDETTTVEFVADKPGTFPFRCGRPCGDGCPRMRGKLTVLEKPPDSAGDGS